MLSGKFIVSGVPLKSPQLTLRTAWPVSHLGGEVYVYENSRALPLWYFAPRVVSKPHTSLIELLAEVDARTFVQRTYLDCAACASGEPPVSGDTLVRAISTPTTAEFTTHATAAHWLVFNESFLPGWEARIDGAPVAITRANGIGMAVFVPPGEHRVTWEYLGVLHEGKLLKRIGIF